MTSGTVQSVLISSIIVPPNRQRRELRNIPILADSIHRLGLIHPIVITRDGVLVAGERRLAAVKSLGRSSIHAQFVDEIDPSTLRAIELEENVKRENITWQEEVRAIADYHEYRRGLDPKWSEANTAEELGYSQQYVSTKLKTAASLHVPEVASAQKFSVAAGLARRAEARKIDSTVASIATVAAPPVEQSDHIICADFHEWSRSYAGPRFNLLHCDFPYGINAESRQQGVSTETLGSYDDSLGVYNDLLDTLALACSKICDKSCHLVFWFSMTTYTETFDFLQNQTPFEINPVPLVWMKSDNVGLLPDSERGPRRIYETAFLGSMGDRRIVRAVANAFAGPTARSVRSHMSEKPQAMLEHFFRMLVDDTTRLLDPTCGSGSALRAARRLGAKSFLGIESNPEFAREATRRLNEKEIDL